VKAAQVVHFSAAQHLNAVRVHEIEMPDQRERWLADGFAAQQVIAAAKPCNPGEFQVAAGVSIKFIDADFGHGFPLHPGAVSGVTAWACLKSPGGCLTR